MNREEIKGFLPHREPMLLVDNMERDSNGVVHGEYTIKGDEFFLQGHFPGMPVVPGVILCEIMGQCSSLLVLEDLTQEKVTMFTGIDKVRFKHPVYPGDKVKIESTLISKRASLYYIKATATVNGNLCVSGVLSVALVNKTKVQ